MCSLQLMCSPHNVNVAYCNVSVNFRVIKEVSRNGNALTQEQNDGGCIPLLTRRELRSPERPPRGRLSHALAGSRLSPGVGSRRVSALGSRRLSALAGSRLSPALGSRRLSALAVSQHAAIIVSPESSNRPLPRPPACHSEARKSGPKRPKPCVPSTKSCK